MVARQAPTAIDAIAAARLEAVPPPDPRGLFNVVRGDLNGLFVGLAVICLIVGAVGIMNTTLVSVLERFGEIGLRRSVGALRRHIAMQFLAESVLLGSIGGLIGTALGVGVVVGVALWHGWTAIVDPQLVLLSPVLGAVTGAVAGVYPALRASWIEPLEALRR